MTATNFWQNLQFDLAMAAALVVVVWGLVRPRDLLTGKPYRWAGLLLVILALSPLLALSDTLVRPLAKSQYVARQAAGLVIVAIVLFIWFYGSLLRDKLAVFAVLRTPEAARRFLVFSVVVVLAILPSDIYLTRTWSSLSRRRARRGAFERRRDRLRGVTAVAPPLRPAGRSLDPAQPEPGASGQARRRHHRSASGFQVLATLPAGGSVPARQVHLA